MTPRRTCLLLVGCLWIPACSADRPEVETSGDAELQVLAAPPLVGRPTATSVTLRVLTGASAARLRLHVDGGPTLSADLQAHAEHDFVVGGLEPAREVTYRLAARSEELANGAALEDVVRGRFVTHRPPGSTFRFAVFSDPHLPIPALEWLVPDSENAIRQLLDFSVSRAQVGGTLRRAMAAIRAARPDFVVCLGDMFYLPAYVFNPPFPTPEIAEAAYLDLRLHLGMATAEAAFFAVVGNWEGENGWHPERLAVHGREARRRLLANPTPTTYPQGGGPFDDYYAWTWGDALFVVLNVMSYTPTVHTLSDDDDGTATSWTLGAEQWRWLETTLAASSKPLKMLFIHHTVGGNGGDERNSAYGRGGGRAARVGEQTRLHEMMITHGVQVFFYGHDHVFTEQVVDGVHYVLPGSAGAPWKFPTEETGYEDYDPRSGFALVRVEPGKIAIDFCDLEGEVFHTIEIDPEARN